MISAQGPLRELRRYAGAISLQTLLPSLLLEDLHRARRYGSLGGVWLAAWLPVATVGSSAVQKPLQSGQTVDDQMKSTGNLHR